MTPIFLRSRRVISSQNLFASQQYCYPPNKQISAWYKHLNKLWYCDKFDDMMSDRILKNLLFPNNRSRNYFYFCWLYPILKKPYRILCYFISYFISYHHFTFQVFRFEMVETLGYSYFQEHEQNTDHSICGKTPITCKWISGWTFCIGNNFETFSALLAICAGSSPVTGEFPTWSVNSPHKGQWRGALMFSLICDWINGWVNSREACDLRRHHAHYDVTMMVSMCFW